MFCPVTDFGGTLAQVDQSIFSSDLLCCLQQPTAVAVSALSPADLHCKYWHDDVFVAAPGGRGFLRGAWKKKTEMKGIWRKNVFEKHH